MAFQADIVCLLKDGDETVRVRLRRTGEWVNGAQWLALAQTSDDDHESWPWWDEFQVPVWMDGAYTEDGLLIDTPGALLVDENGAVETLDGEMEQL